MCLKGHPGYLYPFLLDLREYPSQLIVVYRLRKSQGGFLREHNSLTGKIRCGGGLAHLQDHHKNHEDYDHTESDYKPEEPDMFGDKGP